MVDSFSILLFLIGATGILANGLLISILHKYKSKKTVFQITIFSLGVADFLVSLVMIYSGIYFICEDLEIFPNSQQFLLVLHGNLIFCQISSFLHVLFIAVERLLAVFYPLRFRHVFTKKICITVLAIIWAASFPLSFVKHNHLKFIYKPLIIVCAVFLLCVYSAICTQLTRRRRSVIARTISEKDNASLWKIVAHSFVVTIAFLVCILPYVVITNMSSVLGMVARLLVAGNVLINPIVYFLFAHYKKAIRSQSFASANRRRQQTRANPCSKEEPPINLDPCSKEEPPINLDPCSKEEPPINLDPCSKEEPPINLDPCSKEEPPINLDPCSKEEPPINLDPCSKEEPPIDLGTK